MKSENSDKTGSRQISKKYIFSVIAGSFVFIFMIYFGMTLYFKSHFFINTVAGKYRLSGMNQEQIEAVFQKEVENYKLVITGNQNMTETLTGSEIGLEYEKDGQIKDALEKQNVFLWPVMFFRNYEYELQPETGYDANLLEERISSLKAVTCEQIPAESACPEYDGEKFVIVPQKYGTEISKEKLNQKIREKIEGLEESLDLESDNCYADPAFTEDSAEVKEACDRMNAFCEASIVYTMDENVVIDKATISGWLSVDENMQVCLDEEAVRKWLEEFGDRYDTAGTTRTFTTPTGEQASVTGGTYGWSIDEETEFDVIIRAVKNGETLEKEPAYYIGGTAASHKMPDWGTTYVDVDLSAQHMWYVSDGSVLLETDVVTGEPIPAKITPEGVYSILEKGLNQVLVGAIVPSTGKPEYRTPVRYWMRVTWSGIGFHDADWQSSFGGTRNQITGVGSHGCINMPVDMAGSLYNMIEVGTPVVIHY